VAYISAARGAGTKKKKKKGACMSATLAAPPPPPDPPPPPPPPPPDSVVFEAAVQTACVAYLQAVRRLNAALRHHTETAEHYAEAVMRRLETVERATRDEKRIAEMRREALVEVRRRLHRLEVRYEILIARLAVSEQRARENARAAACVVCWEHPWDTLLLPCRHVHLCGACAARLPEPRRCPLCRAGIEKLVRLAGV
jgi:hypothetical protein